MPKMADPVLDIAIYNRLLRLPRNAGATLIGMFLKSAPVKLAAMDAALKIGELDLVSNIAHTLIASAGTLGCVQMQRLAESIQKAVTEGRRDAVPALAAEIAAAYARVRPLIEARQALS